MRILFMGTPEYALLPLKMLYSKHEIVGVITRADKPNRRGNKIQFSPIKEFALEKNIPIFQPDTLRDNALIEKLRELKPDISVVVAFGLIVPDELINMPPHKTINIHGSLLPKYRGAAPMQYSVLNGDEETGVSIMYITKDLDAGDVLAERAIPLGEDETFGEVHDRLSLLGAELLDETISAIERGDVKAIPQDATKATFAPSITKEECVINWSNSDTEVHNRIRGLSPIPCANTHLPDGKLLKIYKSQKITPDMLLAFSPQGQKSYTDSSISAGTVIEIIKKKGAVVKCKSGAICILSAKPEGKKEMPGFELINGHYLKLGDQLC